MLHGFIKNSDLETVAVWSPLFQITSNTGYAGKEILCSILVDLLPLVTSFHVSLFSA